MRYLSTRGQASSKVFSDILLEGFSPDQGLYIPEGYPNVFAENLQNWSSLSYPQLASQILQCFAPEFPVNDLARIVDATYTPLIFRSSEITPLQRLEDSLYLLHLSEGPTLAFKDIALQLLANLLEHVLQQSGHNANIVGATSGDTGSAAEYALYDKKGICVFMLSPYGKISPFQQAQMYSLRSPHIHNLAIRGVFDDCQALVKALNEDLEWKTRYRLSTVNSINWARICAQVVYYFKAYFAIRTHLNCRDQKVNFSVPTGNFGNVYAGYVAKRMGLPIDKLIVATNENDVLAEFFGTGVYRIRGSQEVLATSSPSMDIAKASNLERLIYDAVAGNAEIVRQLYAQLEVTKQFDSQKIPYHQRIHDWGFWASHTAHLERLDVIRAIFSRYQTLVDPHTANAVGAAWRYLRQLDANTPIICLETAAPAKFGDTIYEALQINPPRPAVYIDLENRPQFFEIMEPELGAVKRYIEKHAVTF